ncbi:MFS transporter [Roseovarius sp. 22II1-1F6A]|nr:MFS transporter [Roseovarius sp. 22II1-1F6A]
MSKFPELMLAVAVSLSAGPAMAAAEDAPGFDQLGRPATAAEIAAWNIDIRPDGTGLPDGQGSVSEGEAIYTEACASCHGDFGEARGRWPVLAGGADTLTADRPVKTIGSYWPYLSTVYDYVHRAMPFGDAQSLSDDQVYAITAYLLFLNWEVEDDFVLSRANFTETRLPNEDGFMPDDRAEVELPLFSGEVCMSACKDSVTITGRAAVVDVTPDDSAARSARHKDSGVTEADAAQPADAVQLAEASGTGAQAAQNKAPGDAVTDTPADMPTDTGTDGGTDNMAPPDPALVAAGEQVFRKCKACHQVGEGAVNRSGPHLNGVFGRQAGTVEDFRYSSAMEDAGEAGLTWTSETLGAFLTKPRDYLKGTKMAFPGLRSADDIAAIEAYLRATGE